MHAFKSWQRWLMAIFSLPAIAVLSTFIVSQTQISQLIPATMPFQPILWTALQLSLASGLVWLIWRKPAPRRNWSAIGKSISEGIVLFGMSIIIIGWLFQLVDITWHITTESIIAIVGLALPLAWWSMAEERVLRGELHTLLGNTPSLLRDLIMLSIGWFVQMNLASITSLFVAIIILLTEGLSVITWSGSADFERTWARRWVWRWIYVVGAGVSSTGFVTATPSPLIITTDDPFMLVILVAAPLALWIIYGVMQNYRAEQSTMSI